MARRDDPAGAVASTLTPACRRQGQGIRSNGTLQLIKDKQTEKDLARLAQLRTKREKRLLDKGTKSVA